MLNLASDISFTVILGTEWPHNKAGISGKLDISFSVGILPGKRLYIKEEMGRDKHHRLHTSNSQESIARKWSATKWRRASPFKELPSSLPVAKFVPGSGEVDVTMHLDSPALQEVNMAGNVLREVRTQVPPEMFDVSEIVFGTYLDARLLILRAVDGSALLLTRTF